MQMQRIIDAIRKGDGEGACNAAFAHVSHASAIVQKLLAEQQGEAASSLATAG
jgi:DNA-binding GntR family transcriptional regulator